MDPWPGPLVGAYLLIIEVAQPCSVQFGRFNGGAPVEVQDGTLLYIGSATGSPARPRLAHRIVRHLTRSGDAMPHRLRARFLAHCRQVCSDAANHVAIRKPPDTKRLRWHIDYLLDLPEVSVDAVWMARDNRVDEATLYATLHATGHTLPVAKGLGASDHRNTTHVLYWRNTLQTLEDVLNTLCLPED